MVFRVYCESGIVTPLFSFGRLTMVKVNEWTIVKQNSQEFISPSLNGTIFLERIWDKICNYGIESMPSQQTCLQASLGSFHTQNKAFVLLRPSASPLFTIIFPITISHWQLHCPLSNCQLHSLTHANTVQRWVKNILFLKSCLMFHYRACTMQFLFTRHVSEALQICHSFILGFSS